MFEALRSTVIEYADLLAFGAVYTIVFVAMLVLYRALTRKPPCTHGVTRKIKQGFGARYRCDFCTAEWERVD